MTREDSASSSSISVRTLRGAAEWSAASSLYRRVFGYKEAEHSVSPKLLAALLDNGGSVIGAFTANEMVGFCYGVSAVESGELYHYSQAAVVAPEAQGKGIGRRLKYAQADAARAIGAHSMRWAFDPYALRNAHFNLSVLHAVGIQFRPDFYGDGMSDRVVVRWPLDLGTVPQDGIAAGSVRVPASATVAAEDPAERQRLRAELVSRLSGGQVLVGVTRSAPDEVSYNFEERQ